MREQHGVRIESTEYSLPCIPVSVSASVRSPKGLIWFDEEELPDNSIHTHTERERERSPHAEGVT